MRNKLVLFLLLSIFAYSKEILLLHSYHKGYQWSDSISEAIEKSFKDSDVEITTDYMDTKRVFTPSYTQKLSNLYKEKYKNRKFDLIIAVDNNAIHFLDEYHDKIFIDTPIVFCGFNNFDKNWLDNSNIKNRTTGVVEDVDIKRNIDLILKLHPNISKLMVLNDTTTTGQEVKKQLFKVYEEYKTKIELEYIDRFKIEELKTKVKNLNDDTVILFMLLFKDDTGKIFTFKDGLRLIEQNTDVPIYGLWDFYLDFGLVGGYVTYANAQGRYAADLAKELLAGKDISKVAIINKSPNRYIFDYYKLNKFGIDENDLPFNSLIENRPFDFYQTHKVQLFMILFVFIGFIVIIVLLIISLAQKKKARNDFKQQLYFIEALLNTIKNPISYKDRNGKYIGCNDAFCEFFDTPKKQIIGKTMKDFFADQKEFLNAHEEIEQKLFNKEEVGDFIMDFSLPNGKVRTMLLRKTLYHGVSGNIEGILSVLHDITDFVNAQKEKKQNESFLAQQSKLAEIGEMISAIAHQWNEPLVEMSAIVQDLELQYQTSTVTKDDIHKYVNDSMVQIQYMSKTLKDFRDFLKPSVKKSHFDIKDAFDEVLNILERQIKYSYIDLKIDYEKDSLSAYGYKNEFMQVLITIINNAKDAILKLKSEDKKFKGLLEIIVSTQGDKTKIVIIDNGCGVKEEDKEKVFEPYYSTKSSGNGLGLYMSKVLICDKMDGEIYFCKNCDKTTLVIELPKDEGEQ